MGDFNYRFMSWPLAYNDHSITTDSQEFVNCLEDNFFTQHVNFSTRNDAILDLVISDEPHMVYGLTDLGAFSGSDHKALMWKLRVKSIHESAERTTTTEKPILKALEEICSQLTGLNCSLVYRPN